MLVETAHKITLRGCLHGGRKILALGRSMFSVYTQKVVLDPSARIFLVIESS